MYQNQIAQQTNKYMRRESFLVVLDSSRNASTYVNGSKNSWLDFEILDVIKRPTDCLYMTMCVHSFTCPVSFYIINSTNNFLSITLNSITYPITVPAGNYNVNSFISTLTTLLASVTSTTFIITMNDINNILTISNSTFNFTINSTSTIYQIMGFKQATSYTSTNKTLTLPFTVNFSGLNSFNIQIENIKTSNLDSYDNCISNIIAVIPVNADANETLYYEKRNDFEFDVRESIIDYFEVQLIDDKNNYLDLNNQHFNLTLQINFIRDVIDDSDLKFNDIVNFGQQNNF
jgi:hypothetical protein